MGFITNQWVNVVEGIGPARSTVAHVTLGASRPRSDFSRERGLVMRLVARKTASGEQHVVHFDSDDLLSFLECAVKEVGPELRAQLVSRILGELSDEELVSALDGQVSRRCSRRAAG